MSEYRDCERSVHCLDAIRACDLTDLRYVCAACWPRVTAALDIAARNDGGEWSARWDRLGETEHVPVDPAETDARSEAERLGAVLTDYRWLLAAVGEALSLPEAATQSDAEQQRRQLMEARAVSALAAVWSVVADGGDPGREAASLQYALAEQRVCYATAGEPVTS